MKNQINHSGLQSITEPQSENGQLDMDQCLQHINPKGRYQISLFAIFILQSIVGSFLFGGGPYYFEDPIFICKDGKECKQKDACDQGDYSISDNSNKTLTLEFELYCDRQYLKSLCLSFIFIGSLVGTFFFSFISDLRGRRISMIISWVFAVLGVAIFSFSQSVTMVIIGLFTAGLGIYPASTISFIVMSEQSTANFRKIATGYLLLGYTTSEGIINLLGYVFHNDWKILTRYWFFIPIALLQLSNFYIIESPRFFLNKDNSKVTTSLNAIGKRNAASQKNALIPYAPLRDEQIDFDKYKVKQITTYYSYWTLMKYRSIRQTTIFCSIQKFLMIFVNFGMAFSVSEIGFNIYINNLMGCVAELISFLFLGKVLSKLKRKPTALTFQMLTSAFCLLFIAFPVPDSCTNEFCYQKAVQITLYFLAKISSCSYFVVISTYFPELYPTVVRSLGVGFIRATGIAGSILSSFAITWSEQIGVSPLVSFGAIGSLSCIFGFFLPETQHKPLLDEIEEEKQDIHNSLLNKDKQDDSVIQS